MGASEQPPLPLQTQNQTKVRGYMHTLKYTHLYANDRLLWVCRLIHSGSAACVVEMRLPQYSCYCVAEQLSKNDFSCFLLQPVPTIGRSSLSLIQLTNSSPGQRPQNHMPMAAAQQNNMGGNRGPRPLDQVTCYKVSHLNIYLLMRPQNQL